MIQLTVVGSLALVQGASLAQSAGDPQDADRPLGAGARIARSEPDYLWLEPGTTIRSAPRLDAATVTIVDARVEVAVSKTSGDWIEVAYAGRRGWVTASVDAALEASAAFSTSPDAVHLARARALMGLRDETTSRLGQFSLHTDLQDPALLDLLATIVEKLPDAYQRRFGLEPGDTGEEAVVIFAREQAYREFTHSAAVPGTAASGHAMRGLAVLFVGDQTREQVAAILVHELAHLLNRRVFGPLIVPWIEEGISNDLAYCSLDQSTGELRLGSLGGQSVIISRPVVLAGGQIRLDREVRLTGPVAALSLLQQRESLPPVEALLSLGPDEFMEPDELQMRYDLSTFLVRYLLGGNSRQLASGFRQHLQRLQAGEIVPDAEELLRALGPGATSLDREFKAWLHRQDPVDPGDR